MRRANWCRRIGTTLLPASVSPFKLTNKTVIRAGYGVFYSSYEAGPLSIPNPGNNPPFYAQANFPAVSFAAPNPLVNLLSRGLPVNALSNPAAPSLFSLDPNFRDPYVQHWNFGIQRELGFNTVWEISYAGSAGKKLYEFRNVNQAVPTADPNADVDSRRPDRTWATISRIGAPAAVLHITPYRPK